MRLPKIYRLPRHPRAPRPRWFKVRRYWSGNLFHVDVLRGLTLVLDFRENVAEDIVGRPLTTRRALAAVGLDYDELAREGRALADRLYAEAKERERGQS